MNSHITAEFAVNSHGNAAVAAAAAASGVDRSVPTMLGGPYTHTSVCCKLCSVYGRALLPRSSGRIGDGQIDSRLFVGNALCYSKFTRHAIRAVFNYTLRQTNGASLRVATVYSQIREFLGYIRATFPFWRTTAVNC